MKDLPRFHAPRPMAHLVPTLVVWIAIASPDLPAANGSLWLDSSARVLLADNRARQVGDIVTIVVDENNESAK